MALKQRVLGAGKIVLLTGALVATYLLFAAVSMRVALKTREVPVPSLVGETVSDAGTRLAANGLSLRLEEGRRVDPDIPAGHIMAQEPAAGLTTRRQRSVRVWVSSGPRADTVPALVGETQQGAQVRLAQDSLDLAELSEIRSASYPTGAVVAQEPPADSPGSRVSLLVNRGEPGATYVMPDLIGVNGERAAEVLRVRGLRVAVVGDHPYPGVPAGVILRQHPAAGFQVRPGEPISLEVSR